MTTTTLRAAVCALSIAGAAHAEIVRHDWHLMLEYDDGVSGPVQFTLDLQSIQTIEFETRDGQGGLANNPLYEELSPLGENPLYTGAADPGTGGWIESIRVEVAGLDHLHGENIVHRDLATRNVIISTGSGAFTLDPAQQDDALFMSDGAAFPTADTGPLRWMAPESIHTRQYSRGDPLATLTILGGSSFDMTIVPAPASGVALATLGVVCAARRRRAAVGHNRDDH